MTICGIKLTHDGAIALIEGDKLIFSIEMEKLWNNKRFTEIEDTSIIEDILKKEGYTIDDIDYFAIDGWGGDNAEALAIQPRLKIGEINNRLSALNNGGYYELDIAAYREKKLSDDICEMHHFSGLKINNREVDYISLPHVAGHILSAYFTSPFAERNESSYILVWDGGMYPRMYFFDSIAKKIENLGPIFLLIGNIYTIFSQHFGPFKVESGFAKDSLSVAGKVMAYIAKGNVHEKLLEYFNEIYLKYTDSPMGFANSFAKKFKERIKHENYSDEDILCSFHVYIERLLVEKVQKKIDRTGYKSRNLCLSGGCALNIKWNSSIRRSSILDEVYTPPFPNDSGSAIGAACGVLFNKEKKVKLEWNVFSGPQIINNGPIDNWSSKSCSVKELAFILHECDEPVVVLNGRAELGPRALGNRSIIASPTSLYMKQILNNIKKREEYRPISPMCLEERAEALFDPGTVDPYMLFDHQVREHWLDAIPAIVHLDGSARLQTINSKLNPTIHELLVEFEKLSSVPVLCNTSANFNGHGFFCDVLSAVEWGKTNYVWCDGIIYVRENTIKFVRASEEMLHV